RKNRETTHMQAAPPAVAAAAPIENELLEALRQALMEMDPRFRLPLALCYEQGLSQKQAASVLEMPASTVSKYINQGLDTLRTNLIRRGFTAAPAVILAGLNRTAQPVPLNLACTVPQQALQAHPVGSAVTPAFSGAKALALVVLLAVVAYFLVYRLTVPNAQMAISGGPQAPPPAAPGGGDTLREGAGDAATAESVTPPSCNADDVFRRMKVHGTWIARLGENWPMALVPADERYRAAEPRKLTAAIAKANGLQLVWSHSQARGLLYVAASAAELTQALADLRSLDPAKRRHAAWQAGWLTDPRIIEPLVLLVKDPVPEIAADARASLIRLGPAGLVMTLDDAKSREWAELWSGDTAVDLSLREFGLSALGLIHDPRSLPMLEKAATDEHDLLRTAAATALGEFPAAKSADLLVKLTADPSFATRKAAVSALARVDATRARPILRGLLKDPDRSVVSAAAMELTRTGDPDILPTLLAMAHGPNDTFVLATGLCTELPADFTRHYITALLEKDDPALRIRVYSLLGYLGPDEARPRLIQALADEPAAMHLAITRTLGQLGDPASRQQIDTLMHSTDTDTRAAAAIAVGWVGGEFAVSRLKALAADSDPTVRLHAALAQESSGGNPTAELIDGFAHSTDSQVRLLAAQRLEHVGGERGIALLKLLLTDADAEVRVKASHAAVLIKGPTILPVLETALDAEKVTAVRAELMLVVGSLGKLAAQPRMRALLDDPAPQIRWSAFQSLLQYPAENQAAMMGRLTKEPHAKLFSEMAMITAQMFPNNPQCRDILIARLKVEKEPWVRQIIANLLRQGFAQDPAIDAVLKDFPAPEDAPAPPNEDEF
ncbi:MAG TPA: HEAT repeat domain-containing protein, partial [Planctomycetota bacterium]|nr:HEAT repeat domain-containing protein [Planctomycetota bacterium]